MALTLSTGISSALPLPFTIHFQIFGESVEYNAWFVKRSENILFCTKDQSGYRSSPTLVCECEPLDLSRQRCLGNIARDVMKQKGHCRPVSLLSIGWGYFLRLLIIHGTMEYLLCVAESFLVCFSDFRAQHRGQELHPCPSPSLPRTSLHHRASAVTYMVHELRGSNRIRPVRPTR